MSFLTRVFFVGACLVGLAACAGPAPTGSALDTASRSNISISEVVVDVSKMGPQTQGRAIPSGSVKSLLEREARAQLVRQGQGNRKVRAVLAVDSVSIITAGQSILVGGESVMAGTVSLVDPRSGDVLLTPQKLSAGGGGWAAGGLLAVATRDDSATELRQMSSEFVARARILTIGDDALTAASRQATARQTPTQTTGTAKSSKDNESDAELEFAVKRARNAAAVEVKSKSGVSCLTLECERKVKRAQDEAEARVRREAALANN